jgi:DNA-binding IclR family transcriptional regulator
MARYPTQAPRKSSSETGGVAAVDRALLLLAAFHDGDVSLSLMELAERTHLVKSTALRLLASLIHFGVLQKMEDGRYSLGPEIARLQSIYTASFSLEALVLPVLRHLVMLTKESAAFHVRQGDMRLCLHRVDSPQPIRYHVQVGELLPLDRGAGGRVIGAYLGEKGPIYDRIRQDGAAALVGDRSPDLAGISAPVFKAHGELLGAVTLTMPTSRFQEEFVQPVKDAARKISEGLGHFARSAPTPGENGVISPSRGYR